MERKPLPHRSVLDETFSYNAESGELTWKRRMGQRGIPGRPAGTTIKRCAYVKVFGESYAVHRIIWKLAHGFDPPGFVDHVNGNPLDNRLLNLRLATPQENAQNKKPYPGVEIPGVHQIKKTGRWRAKIQEDGRQRHIGVYETKEDAAAARKQAEERVFGEFARR